jgi:hypothetical protein
LDDVTRHNRYPNPKGFANAERIALGTGWANEDSTPAQSGYKRETKNDQNTFSHSSPLQPSFEPVQMAASLRPERPPCKERDESEIFLLSGEVYERIHRRVDAVDLATPAQELYAIRGNDQDAAGAEEHLDRVVIFLVATY